jgi:hypothetical protein
MKIDHEETKSPKGELKSLCVLRFFVVDFCEASVRAFFYRAVSVQPRRHIRRRRQGAT